MVNAEALKRRGFPSSDEYEPVSEKTRFPEEFRVYGKKIRLDRAFRHSLRYIATHGDDSESAVEVRILKKDLFINEGGLFIKTEGGYISFFIGMEIMAKALFEEKTKENKDQS